jgi:hypothetical protein
VFVFVTISKFGALNCALIGLGRKILSLILSFVLYGHTMNAFQTVGLALAIAAMIANFYEKGGNKEGHGHGHGGAIAPGHEAVDALGVPQNLTDAERTALLAPDIDDIDDDEEQPRRNLAGARPPLYRDQDDSSASKGIELSNRGGIYNSEAKHAAADLLDLADDAQPASYNSLPPEAV